MWWLTILMATLPAGEVHVVHSEAELMQTLAAATGKPAVVHFWATWCESCVEEFPTLTKAANAWMKDDVELIFFSVDDPKKNGVAKFLVKNNATFGSYLIDVPNTDAVTKLVDKSWNGTIPSTFVTNAKGERTGRFIGTAPRKKLAEAVKRALAQ